MKQLILSSIPTTGRITRSELSELTGLSDRCVRQEIELLRRSGHKIHSCSDKKGYTIVITDQEDKELLLSYFSRLKSEYETLVAMYGTQKIDEMLFEMINKSVYTG